MDAVQQHHTESEYLHNPWVDLGNLQHQQHQSHGHSSHPSNDYGMYGFVESQQLSTEPSYRMPNGAPSTSSYYTPLPQWQFPTSGLQQPFMPQTTNGGPMSIPPGLLPNVATMTAQHTVPTTISAPRRTLTDVDRRKMCLYHEENPNVKQTEIGAMFGVERSTVSKVLRQKEKYLNPDDGSKSPVKRSKGKFPDIERALSNWAKNTRGKGTVLTDAMIREKAKYFAQSCGMSEAHFKLNNASWLEKFKMKNNLQMRHNSDAGISKTAPARPGHSRSISLQSIPRDIASPISATHSNGSQDSPEGYMDFGYIKNEAGQRHYSNSSSTSLSSMYTDGMNGNPLFSPTSPTSPMFSPTEGLVSPLFPSQQARLPPIQHQRPRSSTFPSLVMDPSCVTPPSSTELGPPRQLNRSSTMNSANSLSASPIPEETAAEAEAAAASMLDSAAPTKEDARKALHLVMSFFKQQPSGAIEADEFVTVEKLLDRLDFGASTTSEIVPQAATAITSGDLQ